MEKLFMEKIYFSATENTICLSNVCEHKIPCKASGRMKNGRNHGETGEKSEKGDAEAFIALMEQNRQSMIRIAFAYLGNEEDVADAMQETILSAFEKLDTLRRAEYFRTWLIRILINQCIAMRRHRSRTVPMNEAEEASQFYDFSTDLEFNDLLKTLPKDSRLIFQMYYGEQFSIGEIAQLLHMKENTVKSKIHRGREQLRSQMGVGKENSHDKQSVD